MLVGRTAGWPSWMRNSPFVLMHIACLGVFFTGMDVGGVALCFATYFIRMFGITAGYHRYFSHRSYKTSRPFQFVLAWLGCSAMQKGPLWWAAHHRHHHKYSDTEDDPHSPRSRTLLWSHVGWILSEESEATDAVTVRDLLRYPELRFVNRNHWLPGLVLAVACFLIHGWIGLVWGFFISTVLLYHAVFFVNSLCHIWGRRRFATNDHSRNNLFVALLTLGEGWHNNHHYYQSSANQGFFWWEVDISYYLIRMLGCFGFVWDIRKPPKQKLYDNRINTQLPQPELAGAAGGK